MGYNEINLCWSMTEPTGQFTKGKLALRKQANSKVYKPVTRVICVT